MNTHVKKAEDYPIGLMPDNIWIEQRVEALQAALWRYTSSEHFSDSTCVEKWTIELKEHLKWLGDRRERIVNANARSTS